MSTDKIKNLLIVLLICANLLLSCAQIIENVKNENLRSDYYKDAVDLLHDRGINVECDISNVVKASDVTDNDYSDDYYLQMASVASKTESGSFIRFAFPDGISFVYDQIVITFKYSGEISMLLGTYRQPDDRVLESFEYISPEFQQETPRYVSLGMFVSTLGSYNEFFIDGYYTDGDYTYIKCGQYYNGSKIFGNTAYFVFLNDKCVYVTGKWMIAERKENYSPALTDSVNVLFSFAADHGEKAEDIVIHDIANVFYMMRYDAGKEFLIPAAVILYTEGEKEEVAVYSLLTGEEFT